MAYHPLSAPIIFTVRPLGRVPITTEVIFGTRRTFRTPPRVLTVPTKEELGLLMTKTDGGETHE